VFLKFHKFVLSKLKTDPQVKDDCPKEHQSFQLVQDIHRNRIYTEKCTIMRQNKKDTWWTLIFFFILEENIIRIS